MFHAYGGGDFQHIGMAGKLLDELRRLLRFRHASYNSVSPDPQENDNYDVQLPTPVIHVRIQEMLENFWTGWVSQNTLFEFPSKYITYM